MNYDLDTPDGMKNSIEWQKRMVDMLPEGGVWIVPRSNAIYLVFKETKQAWRAESDTAVDRVFKEMGWTVTDVMEGK